jgi:hypothetical protein
MEEKWTCKDCLKSYGADALLGASHTFYDGEDVKVEFVCKPCMYSPEEAEDNRKVDDSILAMLDLLPTQ